MSSKEKFLQEEIDAVEIEKCILQTQMNADHELQLIRNEAMSVKAQQIYQQIPLRYIPTSTSDYHEKLGAFQEEIGGLTELQFVKLMLQLQKIVLINKKLPARCYTVNHNHRPIALVDLRKKLFDVLK